MTSRLKRKLNDLGVDPSSSKANESFCLIGTPLPPLEKSKDTGEFVPLWKQEVRDEKGRRRLHGAFTGGFSAGYFNTVGSKEGWTPSTFVSSRAERAKKRAVRPEDFMDEEDLAELRESKKLVDENEEMDFGGTEAELRGRAGASTADQEDDSMVTALAASLAPPVSDSVGARILKKMGWRMGQGIGPRITYAQRKAQDQAVGISAAGPDAEGEDEEAKKHLYARRDTPLLLVSKKTNAHGLGYVPGLGLHETLGVQSSGKRQGPQIAAGFGLGALNDADEDDLDVYDGSMPSRGRNRVAYDAEDDHDRIVIGSSRHLHKKGAEIRAASASGSQTFRDGRLVLKGFVISSRPVAEDRWFPLPDVPKGWKPDPKRVWQLEGGKENIAAPSISALQPPKTHAEWKSSQLSADERGAMLGETPLPAKPRSVFDYLSQKDRERLQNIRNAVPAPSPGAPPAPSASAPEPVPSSYIRGQLHIPHVHPSVAKAALQGFQPFAADPFKHSRYTAFLQFVSQGTSIVPSDFSQLGFGPTPNQSIDDFNKELSDYAKSATVFKPLSGAMAGRFRSAVIVETGPKIIEGLHTPDISAADEGQTEDKEEKKEEDPRMAAVRLGMYGPLTREITPWQPAKLLCKRFGVKEPELEPSSADLGDFTESKQAIQESGTSKTADAATPSMLQITDGTSTVGGETGEKRSGPRNLANVGLGEDEDQGVDTLTYQRPSMDVFKAIFASDDEESDDEDGTEIAKEPVLSEIPSVVIPAPKPNGDDHTQVRTLSQATAMPSAVADEKVDMGSFKPTFVPRSDRESRKEKIKDKTDKEKKKKKAALVSFDAEEDSLQVSIGVPQKDKRKHQDGERKKKKRRENKEVDEDDGMWVEKPPPEAVLAIPEPATAHLHSAETSTSEEREAGPARGRKRAIDFM